MQGLLKRRILVGAFSIGILGSIFSPISPLENSTGKLIALLLIVIGSGIGVLIGKYPKLANFVFPIMFLWVLSDPIARFLFKKEIVIPGVNSLQETYYFISFGWGLWFCRNLYLNYFRRDKNGTTYAKRDTQNGFSDKTPFL